MMIETYFEDGYGIKSGKHQAMEIDKLHEWMDVREMQSADQLVAGCSVRDFWNCVPIIDETGVFLYLTYDGSFIDSIGRPSSSVEDAMKFDSGKLRKLYKEVKA